MIRELEITPEDIAEAALLPFRMSKNVVLEVRSLDSLQQPLGHVKGMLLI